jgi:hypothetical protein
MVGFPLLLIPLAIYNIIVLLMPGVSFADPLVRLTLPSGADWPLTLSDLLLALGILMLLLEVFKGARPGAKYLIDHLLSLILFAAVAAEFVLWPKFGTSTYFLLALLALADFLSGIALRARRGVSVAQRADVPRSRAAGKADLPAAEPQFDPAPASTPMAPPAASVATSAPSDHPEPKPAQPAATPNAASPQAPSPEVPSPEVPSPEMPSPEIPSPKLQPGNGSHASPEAPSR